MEEGQLPDWLAELRDQQLSGQQQPAASDAPPPLQEDAPSWLDDLREGGSGVEQTQETEVVQAPPPPPAPVSPEVPVEEAPPVQEEPSVDLLDDLREQMIQSGDEVVYKEPRPSLLSRVLPMQPWQRLVLAVILFLDVLVLGAMVLLMTGRVLPPL